MWSIQNFDIIDAIEDGSFCSSLKELFNKNHAEGKRGLIRGQLPPEYNFGFAKSFRNINKALGIQLDVKPTTRKQNILCTLLEDEIVNVIFTGLSLYIISMLPNPEAQWLFEEASTKKVSHYRLNHGQPTERQLNQTEDFNLTTAHQRLSMLCYI